MQKRKMLIGKVGLKRVPKKSEKQIPRAEARSC